MKLIPCNRWLLILLGVFLAAGGVNADPRVPGPPTPENPPIFHEGFDEYYFAGETNSQLLIGAYTLDESWSGYALQCEGSPVTPFLVPALSSDGSTNLTSDVGGALRWWVAPFWSSASGTNGSGPGAAATLLQFNAVSGDSSLYAWSLDVSADGDALALHAATDGGVTTVLETPITWQSGYYHCLALDYSSSASALFLDGTLVASGSGLPSVPTSVGQLALGSAISGSNAFGGDLDEFYSFANFLSASNVATYYQMAGSLAALGPYYPTNSLQIGGFSDSQQNHDFDPNPSTPCNPGGAPYFTNFTATVAANGTLNISFAINGGVENYLYDIYRITDLNQVLDNDVWVWIGQGFTCGTLVITNQPAGQAYFRIVESTQSTVWAWGDNSAKQCDVPPNLTNAVAVAAGTNFSLALTAQGTILAWGDNSWGQTNVPSGLTNVVAISAGVFHGAALLANGRVTNWGEYFDGTGYYTSVANRAEASAPPTSNAVAIASGMGQDMALMSNGTVVVWGFTNVDGTGAASGSVVPTNLRLTNMIAIACGAQFDMALSNNGAIYLWGGGVANSNVPSKISTNVAAIAGGYQHALTLLSNDTVIAWGLNTSNQTNVPTTLTNIVAISAGQIQSLALQGNGNVVQWGGGSAPPTNMVGVKAISAGNQFNLALSTAGLPPLALQPPPPSDFDLPGKTFTFSLSGLGTTNVTYQWQFDGTNIAGATNATYTVTNAQAANNGTYSVVIANAIGSVTRSAVLQLAQGPQIIDTTPAQGACWFNTNELSLSVVATNLGQFAYLTHYQWQLNGTNIVGATISSLTVTNPAPAEGQVYSVIITNAAGSNSASWTLRLALPGMVDAWGDDYNDECNRPVALTNATAIACGEYQSVAVTDTGTVQQWGNYIVNGTNTYSVSNATYATLPPSGGVVSVAAGIEHCLALMTNGTAKAWGITNTPVNTVPSNLSNVTAVACGWEHNVALSNGVVIAWGDNHYGQTNVPTGLAPVTAISACYYHTIALMTNGTATNWGNIPDTQAPNVPIGLSNIVAVAAGEYNDMALLASGRVVVWGDNSFGQTNVPAAATNNVMAIAASYGSCIALKNDGTLIEWGYESNTLPGLATNTVVTGAPSPTSMTPQPIITKLIAAGGEHAMAAIYYPFIQYPINVSKDLLLIYNATNISASSNMCYFYLTHRPMIANANRLGLFCPTNEGIPNVVYTNVFSEQIVNWLGNNPTLRPQYVILFQDLPSRVTNASGTETVSIQYDMHSGTNFVFNTVNYLRNWNPLVTSINMNGLATTNDVLAYISKLTNMAARNPNQLLIRANAGGYENTNWYIDYACSTMTQGAGYDYDILYPDALLAEQGITNGLSTAHVIGTCGTNFNGTNYGIPTYTTLASNVVGYFTAGADGGEGADYYDFTTNGDVTFTKNSAWYIMSTIDSFSGQRVTYQAGFLTWFQSNVFSGSNYTNTPVGAATYVDEPGGRFGEIAPSVYYGYWAAGKSFAIAAWASQVWASWGPPYTVVRCQFVGDPFVAK